MLGIGKKVGKRSLDRRIFVAVKIDTQNQKSALCGAVGYPDVLYGALPLDVGQNGGFFAL